MTQYALLEALYPTHIAREPNTYYLTQVI